MAVTRQISSKKNQTEANNNNSNEIQEPNSCKPTKPVIRLIGGRIIDSQNGKSCHQCRLKTMYFTVTCKNKDVHWRMPVHHYCHKCLWRRYGEKAEEVAALVDWKCPKCRGICNCSYCRMRRGHQPTRILMHTSKAIGVSSVSNKLHSEGSKKVETKRGAILNKRNASDEEPIVVLLKKFRKSIDRMSDSKWKHRPFKKAKIESGASSNKLNISNEDTLAVLLKKCRKCNGANGTSHSMPKSRPIGILPQTAKEYGVSSVSDMLSAHNKCDVSDEEPLAVIFKNWRKDNVVYGTSDSKSKHMPFENGGDSEKTEGSKLKILRKKYFSHNNSRKSTEDADASINKPTTSDNESTAGLVRITTRKNGLGRESDLKFHPKSPIMEGIEKGTENGMLQHLRNDQELGSSFEGNGQKDSVKKSEQLKVYCRRSKRDQLIKMSQGKSVTKEVSKDMIRIVTDGSDPTKSHEKEAVVEKNLVEEFQLCWKKKKEVHDDNSMIEAHLPQGVELTKLANIDMPADDIGHALQFLEFCEAFGQVLGLKKGQSEMLLTELAYGKRSHQDLNVSVVQLHIKLLTFIQQNSGKDYSSLETRCCNLWLEDIRNCVLESQCPSKEQFIDILNMGTDGYEELKFLEKLRLLNFLCDEALGTLEFRSWIIRQNSEFIKEEQRAARDKVLADKEKVKNMKKQLEGEVAATILMRSGEPLSISEHENLISKIKAEIAQTLAETLQGLDSGMKKEPRSDAVRSEPRLLDADGRIFWKLKSYSDSTGILFQDVHKEDPTIFKEVWYRYEVHDKEVVENYINHQLREMFTSLCLNFQKSIGKGENCELEHVFSEKEHLENEVQLWTQKNSSLQNSVTAFLEDVLEDLRNSNSALHLEIESEKLENEKVLKDIDELKATLLSTISM